MTGLLLRIKRAETPFYANVKGVLKSIMRCNFIPSWKPLHLILYNLHVLVTNVLHRAYNGLWCVPAFQARCASHGKNLNLPCGMPLVIGNLRIEIGDDVSILDSTLASGHVFDNPKLHIGSRTNIGYHTDISVAKEVWIGDDVKIAKDCFIADNNGHPTDPRRRLKDEAVSEDEVSSVVIGNNVWIGTGCIILPGSVIGDNSIIAANSVVTGSVPSNSIYGGSPAKWISNLCDPHV